MACAKTNILQPYSQDVPLNQAYKRTGSQDVDKIQENVTTARYPRKKGIPRMIPSMETMLDKRVWLQKRMTKKKI